MEIILYVIAGLVFLKILVWLRRELCKHAWGNNREYEIVCKKCGRKAKDMIR